MRAAERYVAQGKLPSAIEEYQRIVESDPRDFGTLNMLGDLHAKNGNKRAAIRCYTRVAEHYSRQGFAQKAIAIYNKIARLDPGSVEVSAKLAELYKLKGSLSEARSHYTTLAEHYMSKGWRAEALAIWKQIALLDPNNTEVLIRLAEAYLQDQDAENAAQSFVEAAVRLSRAGQHEDARAALLRGLDARPGDIRCLRELVHQCKILGRVEEAVEKIESVFQQNPRNRDVARLLVDSHIECGWPEAAEGVLIKLTEVEPGNFPKFLDLVGLYLAKSDAVAASRCFAVCAEHLLAAGKADEYKRWLDEILAVDADELNALRMLVRYHLWKRDDDGRVRGLERLQKAASAAGSVEDERYALVQLVELVPQNEQFAERLAYLNELHGFEAEEFDAGMGPDLSEADPGAVEIDPNLLTVGHANGALPADAVEALAAEFSSVADPDGELIAEVTGGSRNGELAFELGEPARADLTPTMMLELEKEVESIAFYIENDYRDLARKSLAEARDRYGEQPEIARLEQMLDGVVGSAPIAMLADDVLEPVSRSLDIDQIRNEFGLDEIDTADTTDYETHYHMAIAYQEMGLIEEAIKEYQDAIALVSADDGSRRFFQCATLLGHCFLQSGMSHLAIKWFQRALETPGLHDEERHGLWYELAGAYEVSGDNENASRYYEQVYSENVDYRDVSSKLRAMATLG